MAEKAHHCTGCRNWPLWGKNAVNGQCCTCCTGPSGERPGRGPTDVVYPPGQRDGEAGA